MYPNPKSLMIKESQQIIGDALYSVVNAFNTFGTGCNPPDVEDSDGDGIPNYQDSCRDQPGPRNDIKELNGCPIEGTQDASSDSFLMDSSAMDTIEDGTFRVDADVYSETPNWVLDTTEDSDSDSDINVDIDSVPDAGPVIPPEVITVRNTTQKLSTNNEAANLTFNFPKLDFNGVRVAFHVSGSKLNICPPVDGSVGNQLVRYLKPIDTENPIDRYECASSQQKYPPALSKDGILFYNLSVYEPKVYALDNSILTAPGVGGTPIFDKVESRYIEGLNPIPRMNGTAIEYVKTTESNKVLLAETDLFKDTFFDFEVPGNYTIESFCHGVTPDGGTRYAMYNKIDTPDIFAFYVRSTIGQSPSMGPEIFWAGAQRLQNFASQLPSDYHCPSVSDQGDLIFVSTKANLNSSQNMGDPNQEYSGTSRIILARKDKAFAPLDLNKILLDPKLIGLVNFTEASISANGHRIAFVSTYNLTDNPTAGAFPICFVADIGDDPENTEPKVVAVSVAPDAETEGLDFATLVKGATQCSLSGDGDSVTYVTTDPVFDGKERAKVPLLSGLDSYFATKQ